MSAHDPKVTGAPDEIWLVYGELEHDDTHDNCYRDGEVTWCQDSQYSSDVRYVRADLFEAFAAQPKPATVLLDEFVYLLLKRVYYPVATELAVADGAQLVNGQWWMPRWGCDTLQHAIDEHGDEQPKPAPVLLTPREVAEAYEWQTGIGCPPLPKELSIAQAIEAAVLKKNGIGP